MSDSTVTIAGNCTKAPELRFTTGGRAVASFGVAVTRKWQQNNEWQEQVSFFNVTAWGTLAENAAASIDKGTRVIVSGRLEQREYDAKDGTKRTVVDIVAEEVGPSLRWARASVERVERESAPQRASRPSDPVYGDESEPF
jgi:single-strand DNA-binding protein